MRYKGKTELKELKEFNAIALDLGSKNIKFKRRGLKGIIDKTLKSDLKLVILDMTEVIKKYQYLINKI